MLDPELIKQGVEFLNNPPEYNEEQLKQVFARIVAGSHQLEGINTTPEEVLEAAKEYEEKYEKDSSE